MKNTRIIKIVLRDNSDWKNPYKVESYYEIDTAVTDLEINNAVNKVLSDLEKAYEKDDINNEYNDDTILAEIGKVFKKADLDIEDYEFDF